jgi:hypothetical protein
LAFIFLIVIHPLFASNEKWLKQIEDLRSKDSILLFVLLVSFGGALLSQKEAYKKLRIGII